MVNARENSSEPPRLTRRSGLLLALALLAFSPLWAENENPVHPSLVGCTTLSKDTERLACFDRAVAALLAGDATKVSPASPQEMFGMSQQLVRGGRTETAAQREELANITARVNGWSRRSDGTSVIVLDNGQVWEAVDEPKVLVLNEGDEVRIERAALSTFRLVTPSKRSAKVRRIR
jgi:hypothetical protein